MYKKRKQLSNYFMTYEKNSLLTCPYFVAARFKKLVDSLKPHSSADKDKVLLANSCFSDCSSLYVFVVEKNTPVLPEGLNESLAQISVPRTLTRPNTIKFEKMGGQKRA